MRHWQTQLRLTVFLCYKYWWHHNIWWMSRKLYQALTKHHILPVIFVEGLCSARPFLEEATSAECLGVGRGVLIRVLVHHDGQLLSPEWKKTRSIFYCVTEHWDKFWNKTEVTLKNENGNKIHQLVKTKVCHNYGKFGGYIEEKPFISIIFYIYIFMRTCKYL